MAENPYAPPAAPVADFEARRYDNQPMYFPVAIWKYLVMYVFTLGLYDIYWFYRNWALIRDRDGSNIMPFWRAFFSFIWVYPLFKRMREDGLQHGVTWNFQAGALATIFIFSRFVWRAPEPVLWFGLLGPIVVAIAQSYVRAVNDRVTPGYDPNNRLTGWNWVAVCAPFVVILLVTWAYVASGAMSR